MPSLPRHVSGIGFGISEEQMIRPDAGRVVAAVTDKHAVRDRAVVDFPGDTMCSKWRHPLLAGAHLAVAWPGSAGCPQPASFRFCDLTPETFSDGLWTVRLLRWRRSGAATNGDAGSLQVSPHRCRAQADNRSDLIARQLLDGIQPHDLVADRRLDGRATPCDAIAGRRAVATGVYLRQPSLHSERLPARCAVPLNDSRFRPSWHYGPPIGQADSEGLYHF